MAQVFMGWIMFFLGSHPTKRKLKASSYAAVPDHTSFFHQSLNSRGMGHCPLDARSPTPVSITELF